MPCLFQCRRGTGFAGPLVAPPWGEAPQALRGVN